MLGVNVLITNEERYWNLIKIVQGEELYIDQRTPEGHILAHVLMSEKQYAEAIQNNYDCSITIDYSKLPDRRDEVSKINRFADELRALRKSVEGK